MWQRNSLLSLAVATILSVEVSKGDTWSESRADESSSGVPDGRIVGGKEAKLGQFPHQALLSIRQDDGGNANCGGTLISDSYVVTAAHCSRFKEIDVTLGSINSETLKGPNAVTLKVKKSNIYTHKDFDHWNLINDIAILKLPSPVKFSDNIKPAKLPTSNESNPDTFSGQEAIISGWGLTENDTYSLQVILRYAFVNISKRLPCLQYYEIFDVNDGTICTHYNGTGTCSGDSGGPMVIMNNKTQEPVLIGITSYGTTNCTDGAPSVFTNVAYYLPWIHNITNIPIS